MTWLWGIELQYVYNDHYELLPFNRCPVIRIDYVVYGPRSDDAMTINSQTINKAQLNQ